MNFCHLHTHTEHSYLDGFGSAKKYIARAKELEQKYIAITNHGSVDGCIEWQKECDKADIKPILGCEAYIVPDANIKDKNQKSAHITLLVKNLSGWESLCQMLSYANLQGFYRKPRIDYNVLLNSDLSGLIVLTGCSNSFLHLKDGPLIFQKILEKTHGYFEIMPHDIDLQRNHHNFLIELWEDEKFEEAVFVATNDCHYIEYDDDKAQEVLLAIQRKATWDDPNRFKFNLKGLHLKSANEMTRAFKKQGQFHSDEIKDAMETTIEIAKMCCDFRIPKQEISLPLPELDELDENEELLFIAEQKLIDIFGHKTKISKEYSHQLWQELNLIKEKGFARYFLIVKEIIEWCKEEGIAVGPGRGSVGGSLVAYSIGITQVDPIKYDLLFSRFMNKGRNDWPDIDIDFEKRYRPKVIEHIIQKYGEKSTCGIRTNMKMQSRAVIRDVCRVFKVPYKEADIMAKAIPRWAGQSDIQTAIDKTPEGKHFAKKYPDELDLCLKLEGQIKASGQHPAAIIIADEDLTNGKRCVLVKQKDNIVCNWPMEESEFVGLMKLDVLGLATLSVISEAKNLIDHPNNQKAFYYHDASESYIVMSKAEREFEEGAEELDEIDFDYNKVPLNDKKVFDMIADGKTSGVFQLSGHSTAEICKQIDISCFNDIAAIVALSRPGPNDSGMTEEYIARSNGEKWNAIHPIYEEITKDTYGILVYQEQVMQVISKVAGLNESTADKIRKVIGKKRDAKEFEPYWKQFAAGCKEMKTLSPKEAKTFWNTLLKWAGYGFNKSHSVAYALIAYWTAWLKVNWPEEFYAASLTYGEWDEKSKDPNKHKVSLLSEIVANGYSIVSPKRKYSDPIQWRFIDNKLYIPFVEINGIGEAAAGHCLEKKKKPKAKSFFGEDYDTLPGKINKTDEILNELCVDDPDKDLDQEIINKYFAFDYSELLYGYTPSPVKIQRKRFRLEKEVWKCVECDLRDDCTRPLLSSMGTTNIAILGGFPTVQEDEIQMGLTNNLLWEEMKTFGYNRRHFHTCLVCRCHSNEVYQGNIDQCFSFTKKELRTIECRLILALGETALLAITGNKNGLDKLNGTTEWVGGLNAWVCWCIHPLSVQGDTKRERLFGDGIKNFINKMEEAK